MVIGASTTPAVLMTTKQSIKQGVLHGILLIQNVVVYVKNETKKLTKTKNLQNKKVDKNLQNKKVDKNLQNKKLDKNKKVDKTKKLTKTTKFTKQKS